MKAELTIQVDAKPGIAELEGLIATLEQAFERFPGLRLKVRDLLFTVSDGSLKPGLVELVAVPAAGANGPAVIQLQVTDRLRKLVAAAAAGDVEVLGIDQ